MPRFASILIISYHNLLTGRRKTDKTAKNETYSMCKTINENLSDFLLCARTRSVERMQQNRRKPIKLHDHTIFKVQGTYLYRLRIAIYCIANTNAERTHILEKHDRPTDRPLIKSTEKWTPHEIETTVCFHRGNVRGASDSSDLWKCMRYIVSAFDFGFGVFISRFLSDGKIL